MAKECIAMVGMILAMLHWGHSLPAGLPGTGAHAQPGNSPVPAVAGATLAEELRRRRMALGWTLEQVAERAQVSVGMLSLIETGKRRPSRRARQAIGRGCV